MTSFYRSNEIQYLELFLTKPPSLPQNDTMCIQPVSLSINSQLMLEEPLSIASVITFGIEGDCTLEELMINASLDDIYGNDNVKTHKIL